MAEDIRWLQRFSNLKKAYNQLQKAVKQESLSELEREGLIQRFEYTYELAWNTLKDYLENQGVTDIIGSKDAIRFAFQNGLIDNGEVWMQMVKSRSLTSHTYNEQTADEIAEAVKDKYFDAISKLISRLEAEATGKQGNIFN